MPSAQKNTIEKSVKKATPKTVKEKKPAVVKSKKSITEVNPKKLKAMTLEEDNSKDLFSVEEFLQEGIDKNKYIETVGRRKTALARVRLFTQGKKGIQINNKLYTEYFPKFLYKTAEEPLEKLKCLGKFGVSVVVRGGGATAQAEAVRHGIAKALVHLNPYFKKRLKKFGYLTRDSRMRERKKPGLKRARRAPQWSKR